MHKALVAVGLLALVALGGVVVFSYQPSGFPEARQPSLVAVRSLLIPLVAVAWGLTGGRTWGATGGVSVGLAVFPWAFVLSFASPFGASTSWPWVALSASVALIFISLGLGPGRYATPDSDVGPTGLRGRRLGWLRWCLILNLTSILNLYLFVVAYQFGGAWEAVLLGSLLGGLLLGVLLLVRGKTVGLVLLAVAAVLLIPGALVFVNAEARSTAEAVLFAILFAPGIFAALGTFLVFLGPLKDLLRTA